MIITRTPLRVSFAGGGTDLPAFYRKEPGAVVSTAIDKYVYLFAHPFFSDHIHLKYSATESVLDVDDVKMPVFREALRLFGVRKKIELGVVADLPKEGGSGLGGSSAFSVGLLHALAHFTGRPMSAFDLATLASDLELSILRNPIGKQDQFASAMGGLNYIQFNPDETVVVEPIFLSPDARRALAARLLLFYTGITREANAILAEQQRHLLSDAERLAKHVAMRDQARVLRAQLLRNDVDGLGPLLHEGWLLKRGLASGITNPAVDAWYDAARAAGAEGGKLLGAGGGGFLLLYVRPERHAAVRRALADLREFPFAFEPQGTRLVLVDMRNGL